MAGTSRRANALPAGVAAVAAKDGGRRFRTRVVAAALLTGCWTAAAGTSYPERPITIVVPFTPGGTVDIVGRAIALRLGEALGQAVIVENKGGAAGMIGTAHVVKAKPDGYTLLIGSTTTMSIRPKLKPPVPFVPSRDLAPIGLLATAPQILLAAPNVPATNVAELKAFSKRQKVPLSYADAGAGTPQYLAGELFKQATGIDIVHIGYKGGGEKMNDVIAGHVQLTATELSNAGPLLERGQVKAIGIATAERDKNWPNIPTLIEQGLANYETSSWFGLFAPAGTPPEIVGKLNAELRGILANDEQRAALAKLGLTARVTSIPEFEAYLKEQNGRWEKAIEAAGMEMRD